MFDDFDTMIQSDEIRDWYDYEMYFGDIMAEVMSFGYSGYEKRIAYEIGKHSGRWVYITDAIDDCESDMRAESYNPFLALYGACPSEEQKKTVGDALDSELAAIGRALDLVDRGERRDIFEILENILDYGMVDSAHAALNKKDKKLKGKKQ